MKEINVGLVGYQFMGKAHSFAYKNAGLFFDLPAVPVMKTICGRNEKMVRIARDRFGWETSETDWKKLVRNPKIDLVDIATPPNVHKDIVIEAAKEGKIIFCEKPLASTMKDACAMVEAVQKYKVKHAICFNYRKLPAIGLAKKMISEGRLGKIYHMRAVYLQDWILAPEFPLVWRLQRDVAGSGAHGDLNAHIIDMARFLVGEFEEVIGMSETFIKERPVLEEAKTLKTGLKFSGGSTKKGKVTVDDATLFLARFRNGAIGSFEATRFAAGRKNGQRFEINGSRGTVAFNLERLNELEYYSTDDPGDVQGFRTIYATDTTHPYAANWWPAGHIIGYGESFVNLVADLFTSIGQDRNPTPDFIDGLRCHEVLNAVEQSIRQSRWTTVKK